jgi:hypothetical protein
MDVALLKDQGLDAQSKIKQQHVIRSRSGEYLFGSQKFMLTTTSDTGKPVML